MYSFELVSQVSDEAHELSLLFPPRKWYNPEFFKMRIEGCIKHVRTALIKTYLNQNRSKFKKKEENNNHKISQRRKEFIWQKYITDLWTEVYYNTKSNVDVYILVTNFENFQYITIWEPIIHLPNLLFISSQTLTYATFMLFLIYQ